MIVSKSDELLMGLRNTSRPPAQLKVFINSLPSAVIEMSFVGPYGSDVASRNCPGRC